MQNSFLAKYLIFLILTLLSSHLYAAKLNCPDALVQSSSVSNSIVFDLERANLQDWVMQKVNAIKIKNLKNEQNNEALDALLEFNKQSSLGMADASSVLNNILFIMSHMSLDPSNMSDGPYQRFALTRAAMDPLARKGIESILNVNYLPYSLFMEVQWTLSFAKALHENRGRIKYASKIQAHEVRKILDVLYKRKYILAARHTLVYFTRELLESSEAMEQIKKSYPEAFSFSHFQTKYKALIGLKHQFLNANNIYDLRNPSLNIPDFFSEVQINKMWDEQNHAWEHTAHLLKSLKEEELSESQVLALDLNSEKDKLKRSRLMHIQNLLYSSHKVIENASYWVYPSYSNTFVYEKYKYGIGPTYW